MSDVRQLAARKRPDSIEFKVPFVICNVVHPTCWRELTDSLVRARELPALFYSVGMHPTSWNELSTGELLERASHPRVVAIGECGFDTHLALTQEAIDGTLGGQTAKLRVQLEVAAETGLPVIIHVRGHENDEQGFTELQSKLMCEMQKVLAPDHPIHVHCFSGTRSDCDLWLTKFTNCYFGFTSKLQNRSLQEVARVIEPSRILLESDAPFLLPSVIRTYAGHTANTSYYLDYIVRYFCTAWNVSMPVMAQILNLNCARLYGLPSPKLF
jgi:TatD DNase family protein